MSTVSTTSQIAAQAAAGRAAKIGPGDDADQLRQMAAEFVNMTFYGTLMREFREAQGQTMLDGGAGGRAFMRQLDTELIRRISHRGDAPLVDAVIRQLGGTSTQDVKATHNLNSYLEAGRDPRPHIARNIDVRSH